MEYASKGMAGAGLGLGIAGTTLGILNGGAGLLGAHMANAGCNTAAACSENQPVNRYEMTLTQAIPPRMGRLPCSSLSGTPTSVWWRSTRT